jgi:hypothetical protein
MGEDIVTNVPNDLKVIPQTSFEQCFKNWKRQWRGALLYKGTILKRIIFSKLYVKKDISYRQMLGTL